MREIDLLLERFLSFPPSLLWSTSHLPFFFADSVGFSAAFSEGLEELGALGNI